MARRRKYKRNPEKYNLREISILMDHHIKDFNEGLKDNDLNYAMKSLKDMEEILEEQKPPVEYLERIWPLIAKAKLKLLSIIEGLDE